MPANTDEFNKIKFHCFAPEGLNGATNECIPTIPPLVPPNDTLNEILNESADLQAKILSDLESVEYRRTADKCPEAINANYSITTQKVVLGRMRIIQRLSSAP
jgi:hypothetical protein